MGQRARLLTGRLVVRAHPGTWPGLAVPVCGEAGCVRFAGPRAWPVSCSFYRPQVDPPTILTLNVLGSPSKQRPAPPRPAPPRGDPGLKSRLSKRPALVPQGFFPEPTFGSGSARVSPRSLGGQTLKTHRPLCCRMSLALFGKAGPFLLSFQMPGLRAFHTPSPKPLCPDWAPARPPRSWRSGARGREGRPQAFPGPRRDFYVAT